MEEVIAMFPAAALIARAVAEEVVGAKVSDRVVPEGGAAPHRAHTRLGTGVRTRARIATALRHAADRVAPAGPSPAH